MTKSQIAELKPCPFCGAKAEYSNEMGAILCEGCGFYFECPTTLDDSLKTWNMREGQIITPKKKTVTVKAWAFCNNGKFVWARMRKSWLYNAPITITIYAKYLRGKK